MSLGRAIAIKPITGKHLARISDYLQRLVAIAAVSFEIIRYIKRQVRCVKTEPLALLLLHTSRTCVTLSKPEVK